MYAKGAYAALHMHDNMADAHRYGNLLLYVHCRGGCDGITIIFQTCCAVCAAGETSLMLQGRESSA
jgi:hypothetical protein